MKTVDLTHTIVPGMPVWPGDPEIVTEEICSLERDGVRVKQLTLGTHTGTHADAPAHVFPGGLTLDQMPIEQFMGLGAVTAGFPGLDELADLQGVDFLLFSTAWEKHWGRPDYFEHYPVPPTVLLERLVHMGLKGVGMDTPSPDSPEGVELPHHHLLLGAGLVVVENLRGLEPLRGKVVPFYALPLSCGEADGAPVRAVALWNDTMEE